MGTLTPAAKGWMAEVNKAMSGGHCMGMAELSLMMYIGKIKEDGQFDVVWKSKEWVAPEPWSELTYPGRACDWSGDGKGSFDMMDGKRSWLSDKK